MKSFKNIRFEVIDETGRRYVRYCVNIDFSIQDNGQTLKVFVTKVDPSTRELANEESKGMMNTFIRTLEGLGKKK